MNTLVGQHFLEALAASLNLLLTGALSQIPQGGMERLVCGSITRGDALAALGILLLVGLVHRGLILFMRRKMRAPAAGTRSGWHRLASVAGRPLRWLVWILGVYIALSPLTAKLPPNAVRPVLAAGLDGLFDLGVFTVLFWGFFRSTQVVEAGLLVWAARNQGWLDKLFVPLIGRSLRVLLIVMGAIFALPVLDLTPEYAALFLKGGGILLIVTVTLILLEAVGLAEKVVLAKYDIAVPDNLQARKLHTQVQMLGRALYVIISLFSAASILMLFEEVRRFGASILASAGVVGIILGFAAQKTISNLFAGFQLALTQPIRLDDVVVVEGEWGRIEEITLTYIVIRLWDERRLVVPLSYFIEKPFQNWTRVSAGLMGSVFVWADYSLPLAEIREAVRLMVEKSPLWDHRFWNVQVSDATERTMQIRVLATAADSSSSWDLRCEIREQLIAYIQQHHPRSLPHIRARWDGRQPDVPWDHEMAVPALIAGLAGGTLATRPALAQTIPVTDNFRRLLAQEDTDGDRQITIHDRVTPFALRDLTGAVAGTVTNEYQLSVLLQELKLAEDRQTDRITMDHLHLDEDIVDRTHRFIKNHFWDVLTRRIDAAHLDQVVRDSKMTARYDYIYVPAADPVAVKYFQDIADSAAGRHRSPALKVVPLPPPDQLTGDFVRNLDGAHGILSLQLELDAAGRPVRGVPYVVPGGRFNELYGWDSYFIVLGLLQDGRTDLARGMADNLLYEVKYYGKIPNANRTYYLTRSQPPFLTSIIRAVYAAGAVDRQWLAAALKIALAEYENVWLGRDRLIHIGPYALSRYYDTGQGPCPEVEPGHYDEKLAPWFNQVSASNPQFPLTPYRFLNEYRWCGQYADLTAEGLTLADFFKHDRALRESGHDTTHRFADRTADYVSIDLNSLLYKYERDFAELLETEFGGHLPGLGPDCGDARYWRQQATIRKQALLALLWDESQGYFFDYDYIHHQRSDYISATGLWPLWAGLLDAHDPVDQARVRRVAAFASARLEQFAGLAATAKASVASARRQDGRQWDYPYGWAPHQMLAWQGFKNYGLDADAGRLAYRWLYTIARNAHDYNGLVPEKYNVVTGSHDVFVEYGNVGTKFSYIATEGFGWMNASFEVGLGYLTPAQVLDLRRLMPPPPP